MSELSIVSKLTVKTMKAQPKKHSVKEPMHVATIYGRCNSKKAGSSDFGEFIRFMGEFEGVSVATGEIFRSGELIVPKTLEALLNDAVVEDASVDFAVDIWVEPSEASITGYIYIVKPLIKPAESDALAELRKIAQDAQKTLPAPDKKK